MRYFLKLVVWVGLKTNVPIKRYFGEDISRHGFTDKEFRVWYWNKTRQWHWGIGNFSQDIKTYKKITQTTNIKPETLDTFLTELFKEDHFKND